MISATAEYALRATVFLARRHGRKVSRQEIANATDVPADYLLKVLKTLDEAGIVESQRGPGGGYELVKPPQLITVLDVVNAVDEIPRIKRCPLRLGSHKSLCPLHHLLDEAAKAIEDAFRNVSLHDLVTAKRIPHSCSFPGLSS